MLASPRPADPLAPLQQLLVHLGLAGPGQVGQLGAHGGRLVSVHHEAVLSGRGEPSVPIKGGLSHMHQRVRGDEVGHWGQFMCLDGIDRQSQYRLATFGACKQPGQDIVRGPQGCPLDPGDQRRRLSGQQTRRVVVDPRREAVGHQGHVRTPADLRPGAWLGGVAKDDDSRPAAARVPAQVSDPDCIPHAQALSPRAASHTVAQNPTINKCMSDARPPPYIHSNSPCGTVTRMTAPRRLNAGQRRPYDPESLLAVAVSVFNTRGYDGTTMEHLSAAAGIGKSSIYHHVTGKEDLLERALNRALTAMSGILDSIDPQDSALDQLAGVVRRSVETLMHELPYVTLLLRVRGNSAVERAALQRRREFEARVVELVAHAEKEGSVTCALDPPLTTRLIFGLVNSVSEWYRPESGMEAPDIPDAVVALVMHGLAPSRSPAAAEVR